MNRVAPASSEAVRLQAHQERALAVAAGVDPRTLRKALAGHPVSAGARAAIVGALKAAGLLDAAAVAGGER